MDIRVQKGVDIVFTPRAQQYLEKNNCKELTIEMLEIGHCCIPVVAPPDVRKGMPREPGRYNLIEKDGVIVYYRKGLPVKPQVTIDVQGFGFIRVLKIMDWEIKF